MKIRQSLLNTEENLYICKKSANNKVKYMIIEFCVSNFLSIKDELKLSFVATTLKESLSEPNDVIPLSDMGLSLVRSAVIYGANASGKTNALKVLIYTASQKANAHSAVVDFSGRLQSVAEETGAVLIKDDAQLYKFWEGLLPEFIARNKKKRSAVDAGLSDDEIFDQRESLTFDGV